MGVLDGASKVDPNAHLTDLKFWMKFRDCLSRFPTTKHLTKTAARYKRCLSDVIWPLMCMLKGGVAIRIPDRYQTLATNVKEWTYR
jgi:hypothetical protein